MKMITKIFYSLHIILMIQAQELPEKFCDPHSNDMSKQCFRKESIIALSHSPNQIAVDSSNCLYFSFDTGQGEYVPAKIQFGNSTITVLKGVLDAFAIASDPISGLVYFGGSHGIYKYNPFFRTLKRLVVDNLDIWWLVIKRDIYFVKFPSLSAFYYENRTVKYVYALQTHSVHQFVFDMDENIFFINSTGLYGIKNGSSNAILLRDRPRFLGMAVDRNGYVYVCSEDGIFIISKVVQKVKKIINVQGVLGMTFDVDNNLIYTDSHEIVRLVPNAKDEYYKGVTAT